jgi:hypothetical protein
VVGLGGTWLLDRASGGWFWTYVFEVHQAHDCNHDRFVGAFGDILGKFPALTGVVLVALLAVGVTWAARRERPPSSGPLLLWSWLFAVSCVVGAVGFATQWAEKNAYVPALLTGAIAAGAAIPALAGCAASWPRAPRWLPNGVAAAAALALWQNLYDAAWDPTRFVPTAEDRRRGDRLIETIRAVEGDVWMPFHPWYARLAGKPVYVHRMGVMDVTDVNTSRPDTRCFWVGDDTPRNPPPWPIRGLDQALADNQFAAIIWDDRDQRYFPALTRWYRPDDDVPKQARPRLYTGARVTPRTIWVPAKPVVPPPGTRVLWNFEGGTLAGWTADGTAWGARPTSQKLPGQKGTVRNYLGRYWVSSMHGGDAATGTLTSPEIVIEGARITFRLSGGRNAAELRAELWVEGALAEQAASALDSERMTQVGWDVRAHRGKRARIVLIDHATGSWGHLNADEFWEHGDSP